MSTVSGKPPEIAAFSPVTFDELAKILLWDLFWLRSIQPTDRLSDLMHNTMEEESLLIEAVYKRLGIEDRLTDTFWKTAPETVTELLTAINTPPPPLEETAPVVQLHAKAQPSINLQLWNQVAIAFLIVLALGTPLVGWPALLLTGLCFYGLNYLKTRWGFIPNRVCEAENWFVKSLASSPHHLTLTYWHPDKPGVQTLVLPWEQVHLHWRTETFRFLLPNGEDIAFYRDAFHYEQEARFFQRKILSLVRITYA